MPNLLWADSSPYIRPLVEPTAQTAAETEFADAIDGPTELGDVAALLRY